MFARYTTVRCDPATLDRVIEQVDGEARAAVEAEPGSRGFAVLADAQGGRMIGASYWDTAAAMEASRQRLAPRREAAAAAVGGELSVEQFEVVVGFRHIIPARGAAVRLTRCELDPSRADEAVTLMREETVPRIKGTAGLCSFQVLLDRGTGAGMVVPCWEDAASAEAFWPTAEKLRARAADRVGVRFSAPEGYTLIRTTVRLD
jgi:heme-degrading monooxygenase HmoA